MARFLVRRERQRTEPDAASFPLRIFAELRSRVGPKTKNKGRKPLKSKRIFLSPCVLFPHVLTKHKLEFRIPQRWELRH